MKQSIGRVYYAMNSYITITTIVGILITGEIQLVE